MIAKNTTREALEKALSVVNAEYRGNIRFKGIDPLNATGSRWRFTLTVEDSKAPGSRFAPRTGRRIAAACWHVHGLFFTALFKLCPEATVSTLGSQSIDSRKGNWQDWVIDRPTGTYASQSCDCGRKFDGKRLLGLDGLPILTLLETTSL